MKLPPDPDLRFSCGSCGHELSAPVEFAGVEGPCPVCGTLVTAPLWPATSVLTTGPVPELPGVRGALLEETPAEWLEPLPNQRPGCPSFPTREEDEAKVEASCQRRMRRLQFFDAALLMAFLGTLAAGGAALAFTQEKSAAVPAASPELSGQIVARMQQVDHHRDQAVAAARQTLQGLLGATDAASAAGFLLPETAESPGLTYPCFPLSGPQDFEFIQARRLPGTERFLMTFELPADPPLVLPVEETPAGTRVHGLALAQQKGGQLGKFLASQGQGEAVFYVLLRPAPPGMSADLLNSRPDLQGYQMVALEPAFPADGTNGCLTAMAPGTETARIFARRAHDPGLRPAVVQLAWRQHRESGNFIELVSFQPNAWSRH